MSHADVELVREAYTLLRRGDARFLRPLVADDATWEPAARTSRRRSENGDELTERWLYRARTHRLHVTETADLGNRVLVGVAGRRMGYMGARWWGRTIFQLVTVRDGRIAHVQDFRTREEALASLGVGAG